ncbi:major facilitator superfamily domain-containing protein [Naematelia encephala]|uniref:Major facilitator superfamily domain-containing protein n=1 Tax=Naematelia encephala TaxID=71784 RepID=A0A1Y2BKD9_9TREE|nr:major facilitator superfamily domain-containing protein [Naematelia encephala]
MSPKPTADYGSIGPANPVEEPSSLTNDADLENAHLLSEPTDGNGVVRETPPFREIAFLCFGLWMSMFTSAVSATVITNLQLTIGSYFEAGDLVSWLGSGYLLGLAGLTPLYGKVAEIMGRRQAMIVAFVLFAAGTCLCAVASSMRFLIFARIVAGCGGGGLLTLTAVVISDTVSIKDRGIYQGYVNLVWATGSALGALVGGWVADRWGWRWAFWMQIPPLILAFALIVWKVHPPKREHDQSLRERLGRIDWLGFVVLLISITTLMISCSLYTYSLPAKNPLVPPLFIAFLTSLPLLYLVERKWAKEPIIPIDLIEQPTPALILVSTMLLSMNVFARFFMCPIYIHVVKGFGGKDTGLLLLPSSLTLAMGAVFGGYIHRIWAELAIAAFAGGIIITNVLTALVASVPHSEMAVATSVLYLGRAIGQVLGASLSAGLQQLVLSAQVRLRFPDDPELAGAIIKAPEQTIPNLSDDNKLQALLAYLASLKSGS